MNNSYYIALKQHKNKNDFTYHKMSVGAETVNDETVFAQSAANEGGGGINMIKYITRGILNMVL